MENKPDQINEKKEFNKAKSLNTGPKQKVRGETLKRKSFGLNDAVLSLDLALGRLKKSKLVTGESATTGLVTHPADMFMELSSDSSALAGSGITDASLMSMNISHYELMRNLSCSTANSDGAFSGNTCNTGCASDAMLKNEFLEKYFRSVDLWHRMHRDDNTHINFKIPDK